ncbi:MAG: 30S ribosomal protein S17 [candidate division Zixibacteria bacterium RBG_16_40_9]|nr:MAG: 30S ribosomal protein S17 [candidate division Zixibacteria bacterium RBG_16_40_9]
MRGERKVRIGKVLSDKMQKTIVVGIERTFRHPEYSKTVKRTSMFYAHDPKQEARVGDKVKIMETRPVSKLKRWRLVEVLEKVRE